MSETAVRGRQIRDGEVKTEDLSDGGVGTANIASSAVSTSKIVDLAVTDPKLPLRGVATSKLATDYVRDGDVVDIGGETLLTTPTLAAETYHVSVTDSEAVPTTSTDGVPLDGASHVCWAFTDASLTSATYQGWVYTTALGWVQTPTLSGTISNGDSFSDYLEVSGAERFALPVSSLTGTEPSVLRIIKVVTT